MDDEIKINEVEADVETGNEAKAEAESETEIGNTPDIDPVGARVDGGETPPQDVADCGDSGDEPGDGPSVEALVAEAERRGYLRGRNERIEQLMAQPGVWEEPDTGPSILNRPRRSIWD